LNHNKKYHFAALFGFVSGVVGADDGVGVFLPVVGVVGGTFVVLTDLPTLPGVTAKRDVDEAGTVTVLEV